MSRVKQVVIVGRDAELWLSALALHRALGRAAIAVRAVELPSALHPSDIYTAAPSLTGLHNLLGIERHDVLRVAGGVPMQGQRFTGWGGAPFVHGYDGPGAAIDDIDILQFWSKGRQQGLILPYEELSVASVAARQGRIGADRCDPQAFGTCHRGYHLDASPYVRALKMLAARAGIPAVAVDAVTVEREGDRIAGITLGHERIEGDLFVDATGSDALLAAATSPFESWRAWLAADRIVTGSLPPLKPLPSFSDLTAIDAGWIGLFPLRARTAVMGAFESGAVADDVVLAKMAELAGGRRAEAVSFRTSEAGTRAAWTGNCVAIGESFTTLEPLDAMQLHLIHAGVSNLIAWFPAAGDAMPEARSYNAVMARYAANVRDFMVAHFRLNGRTGEPFWDRARSAAGPATLEAKIALFAARGLAQLNDEETFEASSWASLFTGHGLVPRSYDPRVDEVPVDEQIGKMRGLLERIAEEVRAMPTVEAYIRR